MYSEDVDYKQKNDISTSTAPIWMKLRPLHSVTNLASGVATPGPIWAQAPVNF